jgi:Icc-related predicted phosphoesterase
MRILAAADLHGAQYRLNLILENIHEYSPDLVVICGDITQFGPGEVALNFLNQIPVPTLAIPGNIDTPEVDAAISQSAAINIHYKMVTRRKNSFIGIGGLLPSPLSKTQISVNTSKKSLDEILEKNSILVTHEPPFKTCDTVFFGHHAGNKELRQLLEKYHPSLILCGHIHENPGVVTVDDTVVVNCSMGKKTEGVLITINDTIDTQILE